MLFINLLFFLIACIFLAGSSNLVVKSLVKISKYYEFSEFVIGFIIIAFATSLPELFVAIMSSLSKIPALSLGNVIGSNIVNLTLVIGIATLLGKRVKIETEIEKRDIFYSSIIALLPLVLFLDHQLSRTDGIALILVFFLYVARLYVQRKKFKKVVDGVVRKEIPKEVIIFVFSLVTLLLSSKFIVQFASLLAIELALQPIFIGLIILSIGTTLPEISFEAHSVIKGYSGMALGNLLGSVVTNSALVLGVGATICPIEAYFPSFLTGAIFLIALLGIFSIFAKTNKEISRKEGIVLLIFYVLFIIVNILTR